MSSRIRFLAKANALKLLKGRWLKADAILILIGLLTIGFTALEIAYRTAFSVPMWNAEGSLNTAPASFIITGVFTLLLLLFLPPLIIAQAEWYWKLSGGVQQGIGEVFGWFGSFRLFLRSVSFGIQLFIRCLLWTLLTCTVPVGLIAAAWIFFPSSLSFPIDMNYIPFSLLAGTGTILLLFAVFGLGYLVMRYFLAVFLLVEDGSRGIRECMRMSVRYSKGRRWELYKFCLTYLPWAIACYFVLPALIALPYFNAASTVLAKHVIYTRRAEEGKPGAGAAATAAPVS